jgi:uncharacterized membrane protein (UPF0182 family)
MATSSARTGAPARPRANVIRFVIAGALLLLLASAGSAAVFYTDLLWFRDLGQDAVFWTRLVSSLLTGLAFGAVAFVVVLLNLAIARRMAPGVVLTVVGPGAGPVPPELQLQQALAQVRRWLDPYIGWIVLGISILFAWTAAGTISGQWELLRVGLSAVTFGRTDPQFGLDVSFFMFQLPALRVVSDWLFGVLVMAFVLTAGMHIYGGAIRLGEKLKGFDPHVKAHLSVLAGVIIASRAFDYWLQIYELNFSPRGQVTGASFTDVNAQLPAFRILIVLALATAVALLLNIRFKGWRLPAIAIGVWVAASLLVGEAYPALIQQFRVTPNELQAESPYITRNIDETRKAFDLADVEPKQFPANTDLTPADIADATATISNVRLWDPNIVKDSYKQLQEIRFYYDFKDVDIDRYVIDGALQQVLVSVREMNVDQLSDQAKTWINQHLIYTHGYGLVVSPVNRASADGLPAFLVKDLPPAGTTDLKVTRPGIYFGEESNAYAIVDTTQKEFDYPVGGQNAETSYAGKGGAPIGTPLERAAFALRFGAPEIILTSAIKPESRILFRRDIAERLGTLAPFLTLDSDPYAVVVDGRIVWVQDCYTLSGYHPYSQRYGGVNYIRNSVKVTIDAYDGTTTLYAFDDKDPVLATYRRIYPGLFTDVSKMPAGIRAHLRYPEDLFKLQAEVYATYHMSDPQVFYNKEDQWSIPGEAKGAPMAPFYVLMELPGESKLSFILMQPFTPRTKDNMIGWMAVRCDGADYGKRIVYNFPKQRLILGPEQIKARMNQEPDISKELTLLNQQGSRAIQGNLLVIPIKDAIVYIQPLYIQAESSPMPELKRVIVSYGDRVVMSPDLATALSRVFGTTVGGGDTGSSGASPGTGSSGAGSGGTTGGAGTGVSASDVALARDLYTRALAAQRSGDWATYGNLIAELGKVLERLAGRPSGATTPTAP